MRNGESDLQPRDEMITPGDARGIRRLACMRGFSLVELLTTLIVMAILVAIAAPSLGQFVASNRVSSKVNDLVGALNVARSEAVRRGIAVTLCKSTSGTACAGSGTDWAVGWIICDDPNTLATCTGRTILRIHPPFEGGTTAIAVPSGMTAGLTFLPIGMPLANYVGGDINVCPSDAKYASFGRKITVNKQGRPQVSTLTC